MDMRFDDIVRAATSLIVLKKGSDVWKRLMRVVLLVSARAVMSEGRGGDGGGDDDDAKASSMYLNP